MRKSSSITASVIATVLVGVLPVFSVSSARAALVDGDRFVITSADSAFSSGHDGATASLDAAVHLWTSFEVLVPHAASGTTQAADSIRFSAPAEGEEDLLANVLVSGFEVVDIEFLFDSSVFL